MHFMKSILRKSKGLFPLDAPLEYLSYAKHDYLTKKENSLRWFDNFIGFKQFKSDEDHLFFAYYSNDGNGDLYLPIYVGYNEEQIENESNIDFPYLVMMYGSDNHSYFIRLKDEKEVNKCLCFISKCKSYSDIKNNYFVNFYNS